MEFWTKVLSQTGYSLQNATKKLDFCGENLTFQLMNLLNENQDGVHFNPESESDFKVVNGIKENSCFVPFPGSTQHCEKLIKYCVNQLVIISLIEN